MGAPPPRRLRHLCGALLFLLPAAITANPLHEWRFDERAGTRLAHTDNLRQPTTNWTVAWADAQTSGDGRFRIRRNGAAWNSRFEVGNTGGADFVWLVATIDGWDFRHTTASRPLMRFSFMNGPAASTPSQITAEAILRHTASGTVTLEGNAEGTGGVSSSAVTLFGERQVDPVTLAVGYSDSQKRYEIRYRIGTGNWTFLFGNSTSSSRTGPSVRMQVSGDFWGGGRNFLDLDGVALATTSPVGSVLPLLILDGDQQESGAPWDVGGLDLHLGHTAERPATLLLDNEHYTLGIRRLRVGHQGAGSLTLAGGARMYVAQSVHVGSNGGAGDLHVTGSPSTLAVAGHLSIGANASLLPSGSTARVDVTDSARVEVGGTASIRQGGTLRLAGGGILLATAGLEFGLPGEGGRLELHGGHLEVGGTLDLAGIEALDWSSGSFRATGFVTGVATIPAGRTFHLMGQDGRLTNADGAPVGLAPGAAIEGTGVIANTVHLGGSGSALRGTAERRLHVVGTVTGGGGSLDQVWLNGTLAPTPGGGGITLGEVEFAGESIVDLRITGPATFASVLATAATDLAKATLRVRFEGFTPSSAATFPLVLGQPASTRPAAFAGHDLPAGWELQDGVLVHTGAPATATYAQWVAAYGLAGAAASLDADPDGDGRTNAAEFRLGTSPVAGRGAPLLASRDGSDLLLRWRQRSAGDTRYRIESSADLLTWTIATDLPPARSGPAATAPLEPGTTWAEQALPIGEEFTFHRVVAEPAPVAPVYPGKTWETITDFAAAGVPQSAITDTQARLQTLDTTAYMVVVGGRVAFQYGDLAFLSYSASTRKSYLSMLFGKYVASGQIRLDESLGEMGLNDRLGLLPIELTATVHDLLRARSGVYHPRSNTGDSWDSAPPRGSVLPGSYNLYNNWDFNALGTILRLKTGKDPYEAMESDFARPLQMEDYTLRDQSFGGNYALSEHLAYYYTMSTRDVARLGYLMLRRGNWAGEQLIPEFWIDQSLYLWTPAAERNPASARTSGIGYSYLWWIREVPESSPYYGSYAAHGAGGQYLMVVPKLDLVLAHKTNSSGTSLDVSRTQFYALADIIVQAMWAAR